MRCDSWASLLAHTLARLCPRLRLWHKILLVKFSTRLTSTFCSFLSKQTLITSIISFMIKKFIIRTFLIFSLGILILTLEIHTLLVHDTPYKTCYLNSPFNVIFVESYEYVPKEANYLMKTLLPYLKFPHYSRLNVPTFVELYPFNAIRSLKEDDVRFWMLCEKCTMACSVDFVEIIQHM